MGYLNKPKYNIRKDYINNNCIVIKKMNIIISGINLYEGGALKVYYDCLDAIISNVNFKKYDVTIFVHKKELFEPYKKFFKIIELPKSRNNYLYRVWYEYIYFYFYSLNKSVDVWISLHDITPNVKAKNQFVYCHNPSPFLKYNKKIKKIDRKAYFFSKYYKLLYRINIKKNKYVIVQQNWIRNAFKKIYKIENIVVSSPVLEKKSDCNMKKEFIDLNIKKDEKVFIYPALPRIFKNFEVICEAVKLLKKEGIDGFKVLLTIDGSENEYSKQIFSKYNYLNNIMFIGKQNREKMNFLYDISNIMIFPSKMETWGLPISEFKEINKPLILADEPYAHETLGNYDKAIFFSTNNPIELSEDMKKVIKCVSLFKKFSSRKEEKPYFHSWGELFENIIEVSRR